MSVNKVILVGNLGRDPEIRYLPNGDAVANFSIATSEVWKDKSGQRQERTEWHNIVMYRRLAEIAGQYLKKGRTVYIEGRIQSRKYTNKEGLERIAYEIIANEMQMVGGRDSNQGSSSSYDAPRDSSTPSSYAAGSSGSSAASAYEPVPVTPPPPPAAPRRMESKAPVNLDDIDDDIPF